MGTSAAAVVPLCGARLQGGRRGPFRENCHAYEVTVAGWPFLAVFTTRDVKAGGLRCGAGWAAWLGACCMGAGLPGLGVWLHAMAAMCLQWRHAGPALVRRIQGW